MTHVINDTLKQEGTDLCFVCFRSSNTKLLKDCNTIIQNPARCELVANVFCAVSFKLFNEEKFTVSSICASCDKKLEILTSFIEEFLQSYHKNNTEKVKVEEVPEKCLERGIEESIAIDVSCKEDYDLEWEVPLSSIAGKRRKILLKCKTCDKEYRSAVALASHNSNQHSTGTHLFQCPVCAIDFSNITKLKQHEVVHSSILKVTCRLCRLKFENKLLLLQHQKDFHHLQVNNQNIGETKNKNAQVNDSENDEPLPSMYCCDVCKEYFQDLKLLKSHISENHFKERHRMRKKKLFICFCGMQFERAHRLHYHRMRVHKVVNKFSRKLTCLECGKFFSNVQSLESHRNTHLGLKPYLCSSCPAAYASPHTLEYHQKVAHQGMLVSKPKLTFLCDNCGKCFVRKSGLQRHMLVHMKLPRAYHCSFPDCSKSFVSNERLRSHLSLHSAPTKYFCNLCNKGFKRKFLCQAHTNRVHLNHRPFICATCGVGFKVKAHLEKHTRTHTGEKPFPCPHCSYRCAEKSNLKKHIKIHDRCR